MPGDDKFELGVPSITTRRQRASDFRGVVVSVPPCCLAALLQTSRRLSERRLKVNVRVYGGPLMLAAAWRAPLPQNSSTWQFNLGSGAKQRGLRCSRGECGAVFIL